MDIRVCQWFRTDVLPIKNDISLFLIKYFVFGSINMLFQIIFNMNFASERFKKRTQNSITPYFYSFQKVFLIKIKLIN